MIVLIIALTTTVMMSSIVFLILNCRIGNLEDKIEYLEEIVDQTSIEDIEKMVGQDFKFGGF